MTSFYQIDCWKQPETRIKNRGGAHSWCSVDAVPDWLNISSKLDHGKIKQLSLSSQ